MSGLALVGHQFRFDQKAFWRNPASVCFTVLFPVAAAGHLRLDLRRHDGRSPRRPHRHRHLLRAGDHHHLDHLLDHADAGDVAGDRPRGRPAEARPRHPDAALGLHRRPGRQLDRHRGDDAGAAGADRRPRLRRPTSPGAGSRRSCSSWSIGAASFSCLGIALTAAIPTQDAAAPIVNFLLLPLYFLSGVFIPDDQLPSGIIHFADVFPIRHFFLAFFDAYVPGGGPRGRLGTTSLIVAIWGVGGLLLAIRFFRWTPRSG